MDYIGGYGNGYLMFKYKGKFNFNWVGGIQR